MRNVAKSYGDVRIVKNMNLEIRDGEFMVLVGPSGCGKSTTLRMIAGLEDIDAGDVVIDGRVVNGVMAKDRDIAMVFQNYALYPHMNVFRNMAFGLELRKMPPDQIRDRVMRAAKILSLETLLERKPKQLSGGQRQRVALGRAIVRDPKVFLFDEPLSNLDAQLRVQMRTEIAKLHRDLGCTMIYVTHDQVEAMTMGTRIVVMKSGDIQQIGAPYEIYRNPANLFVAGFIGTPAMNFVPVTCRSGEGGGAKLEGKSLAVFLSPEKSLKLGQYDGREVVMGIRPNNVHDLSLAGGGSGEGRLEKIAAAPELVEVLGSTQIVYFPMGGDDLFRAEMTMRSRPRTGESMRLGLESDEIHVFDKETGCVVA